MNFLLSPRCCLTIALLWFPSACDSGASNGNEGQNAKAVGSAPPPVATATDTDTGEPGEFANLQVLADDISKADLKKTMKMMARSLGVQCSFCHRTDRRDYASDNIEKKRIARDMMRMVHRMNTELFTWGAAPKATCFMCHHGETKPEMDP